MKLTKQEALAHKQAKQVEEWLSSPIWLEVVKPRLIAKRDQSFPDPVQFKNDKEFNYAAKTASVFKKVIAEILVMFEQEKQTYKALNKKKYGKTDKKFKIGS